MGNKYVKPINKNKFFGMIWLYSFFFFFILCLVDDGRCNLIECEAFLLDMFER